MDKESQDTFDKLRRVIWISINKIAIVVTIVAGLLVGIDAWDRYFSVYAKKTETNSLTRSIDSLVQLHKLDLQESRAARIDKQMREIQSRLWKLEDQYPANNMPKGVYRRYQDLIQQLNKLKSRNK